VDATFSIKKGRYEHHVARESRKYYRSRVGQPWDKDKSYNRWQACNASDERGKAEKLEKTRRSAQRRSAEAKWTKVEIQDQEKKDIWYTFSKKGVRKTEGSALFLDTMAVKQHSLKKGEKKSLNEAIRFRLGRNKGLPAQ